MGNVVRRRLSRANHGEVLDTAQVPAELQSLFDKTPVLSHEDPNAYWALMGRLAHEIKPSDTIEWLWLKDIVDQSWEIVRLRRLKAALLDAGRRGAVTEIFAPVGKATDHDMKFNGAWDEARDRGDKWFDPKTRKQVETRLNNHGLDADSIIAVSFSRQVISFEAAERMLAGLEFRRNNALREIEVRRQTLAAMLRQGSDRFINAVPSAGSSR